MPAHRSRLTRILTAWVTIIGAASPCQTLPSQGPFKAADYLDDGYRNIVVVDFAQLRKTGVWDELDTGMTKMVLRGLAKSIGTPLDRLDVFRMVPCGRPGDAKDQVAGRNLLITEANVPLGAHEGFDEDSWVREKVAGHDLIYRRNFPYGSVSPAPNVRLTGSIEYLRQKLQGPKRPGMPCPDIQSLLSARRKGLLAFVVTDLQGSQRETFLAGFPDVQWPKDDEPQFALIRAKATGDEDDPHIEVEIVLRHNKAGAGILITNKAINDGIKSALKNPQYRFFNKTMKARKQVLDGCDLSITFDLGRARNAIGNIEMLVGPAVTRTITRAEALPPPVQKQPVKK